MSTARRRSWWLYGATALVLVGLVSWLTAVLLRLDRDELSARCQAALHERLRLGLWRLDSWLGPQLAREAMRPAADYRSFQQAPAAWTADLKNPTTNGAVVPSPLLGAASSLFSLHFEVAADGAVRSPQVPDAQGLAFCRERGIDDDLLEQASDRLRRLTPTLQHATLRERLGRAESKLQELGCNIVSPAAPQQLQQSVSELSSRQRNALQNIDANNRAPDQRSQKAANPVAAEAPPGPLLPFWLDGDEPRLVFVRRANAERSDLVQGVLLDWPLLERELLALVTDLFADGARLVRCDQPTEVEQPTMLASLPVRLIATPREQLQSGLPLPWILGVTWGVTLLGLLVLGWTLRAAIGYGERRARFASAVTHELRTPLTTFRMYSEMLADDVVQEPAARREYLRTLQHESDRLARVVENVLAWSRLEEGRFASRRHAHRVADLVDRVKAPLQRRLAEVGMSFEITMAADVGARMLTTDDEAIGQILFNLADNAAKYALASGRVELHVRGDDHQIEFELRDFGPGVPKAVQQRIFAPFDRGNVATGSNDTPGVGLGLALARGLARDLGGDLRLAPAAIGAAFALALPAA
jgi:signal transduction histidine kinase